MSLAKKEILEEEERLENLRSYSILDTPFEESYQNLSFLASTICHAPLAFITFLDSERTWVKANVGMGKKIDVPRSVSFCTHAIKENDIFEVQDTHKDPRFCGHPSVTGGPKIRFYAGAQIKTVEGFNIGTICVIKTSPSKLSPEQKNSLRFLAKQVSDLLRLKKLNHELELSKKLLEERQDLLINKARHQTIGELAGGICHQINNPLAIIVGRSMILRSQLNKQVPDNGAFMKELDVIDQTSQRVSGILKALRTYSREMGEEFSEANLVEIIDDAITLMKGKLNTSGVELVFERKPEILLKMNKNQIGQVVLDLLSNSIDSMENSSDKKIVLKLEEREDSVVITFEDTGEGVPEEIRRKIFEPFFSTKPHHFGVGLSNARNFVLQHKGEINLLRMCNPTVFEVKIPKNF